MGIIYFLIVLLLVLTYGYCNIVVGRRDYVQCVEAGSTIDTDAERLKECSFYDKRRIVRDSKGKEIDTSNMIRIVVNGNGMKPKNIESGAQLLVKKIDRTKSMCDQIKQGDILLIHLSDNGVYKIRIFDKYEGTDLVTYCYDDNMNRKNSSRNYKEASVLGIVKYKIEGVLPRSYYIL